MVHIPEVFPPEFEAFFKVFFLAMLVFGPINAIKWWFRGIGVRREHPERRDTYLRMVVARALVSEVPAVALNIGFWGGWLANPFELLVGGLHNPWVQGLLTWFVSLWLLLLLWVFIGPGAQVLADHPGWSRADSSTPQGVRRSFILGSLVGAAVLTTFWILFFRVAVMPQ